jgi:hypothetical protein
MYSNLYFAILSLVECLFLSGIRLLFPHTVDFFHLLSLSGVSDTKAGTMPSRQQNDFEGSTCNRINPRPGIGISKLPTILPLGLGKRLLKRAAPARTVASGLACVL